MSLPVCSALFFLLAVITPCYSVDSDGCTFPNHTATSNDYKLDVSPDTLSNNTVYTVTVTGSGNVTILLQSTSNHSIIGSWSHADIANCSGGPLFRHNFEANKSLVANWTSPSSMIPHSVNISASITNGTVSYNIAKTLKADSAMNTGSMLLVIIQTLGLFTITRKLI